MRKPAYSKIYAGRDDARARATFADEEWASLCADLEERGLLTEQRKRLVDRLVRERVGYEFLFPMVETEGATMQGPNGGDVWNPKWTELKNHKAELLKLEEALRLTVTKTGEEVVKPKAPAKADKYLEKLGRH